MDLKIKELPVLALRGINMFPGMLITLEVRREISVTAINSAVEANGNIFITAQKDARVELPGLDELYKVGVISKIKQVIKLNKTDLRVLVEGEKIATLKDFKKEKPFLLGNICEVNIKSTKTITKKCEATVRRISEVFSEYFSMSNHMEKDAMASVLETTKDPDKFSYTVASNIYTDVEKRQHILEIFPRGKRLEALLSLLIKERDIVKLANDIQLKVEYNIEKNQKEYFLREQIKVIQDELGDREDVTLEINEYLEKLSKLSLPKETEEKVLKEIKRLQLMPQGSHEGTVVRTYLDTLFELPFNVKSKENINLKKCKKVLDNDHYGLVKVKERILEYLACKSINSKSGKGTILCLVGPPGVGKTSVAESVARAIGRKYERISLGGVRDEADIRGHRRTYIGAMPGRIINAIRLAGTSNPLILLDEIDKMASDFRGDPASALLEVLDKEQNKKFRDHFIEIPFDLSDVMFITTANTVSTIPEALYDRMEVIELSGYTYIEKENIAKKHLVKKQLSEYGITKKEISFTDKAISEIINHYTMEAGVRNLEREIATVIRKAIYLMKTEDIPSVRVGVKEVEKFLGARKFIDQTDTKITEPGVVTGLAYTSYGGTILNIEVNCLEGTGKIELTGKLGDVMKESAKAAICCIRSKAEKYNIEKDFYKDKDIHIHVPEGAVPKDGPSAGITMATAVVSALTGIPVRNDIAMTGEITIRGRVLAIGGLKEKSLAAKRAGITNIIIPYDNLKDIEEIPKEIVSEFNFIPVKNIEEVLENALNK